MYSLDETREEGGGGREGRNDEWERECGGMK